MVPALSLLVLFMGIDVAKTKLDVVVLVNGKPLTQTFANTHTGFAALLAWMAQFGVAQVHACLEPTGSYSDAIAHFLWEQGSTVSVLNPAVLVDYHKAKNLRRKNDRLDAQLLAQYGSEMQPSAWTPSQRRSCCCANGWPVGGRWAKWFSNCAIAWKPDA